MDNLSSILSIGLILVSLFWIVTDPRSLNERLKYLLKIRVLLVQVFEIFLVLIHLFYLQYISFSFGQLNYAVSVIGIFIYLIGSLATIFSKINMGKNWGVPAQLDKDRQDLVITGLYKFSRNPMYLGFILITSGYFLALRSYFIVIPILLFFVLNKAAEKEEKLLEKNFGKKYLEYKTKVPRFI